VARKLIVEVIGDATGLETGLTRAEGAFGKFGKAAKLAGLALAGALVVGIDKSVKAAVSMEASQASLNQSLVRTHQSIKAQTPAIEAAEEASRKLGFTDEDTAQAMARLEIATGSTKKSIEELNVVQDLARTRHMDLTAATNALAQAQTGSQRAAKQLGIIVVPVTTHMDELKQSHVNLTTESGKALAAHAKLLDKMATGQAVIQKTSDKVKGQAQAYADSAAGGLAIFHAELENLEVKIGTALIPSLEAVTTALTKFVDFLSSSPGVAKAAGVALTIVRDVVGELSNAFQALQPWIERNKETLLILGGVLAGVVVLISSPVTAVIALGVALIELYKRSETFRNIVNGAFQAVHDKVEEVMPTIRVIIQDVVTAAEAIWSRFGGTILSVIRTALDALKGILGNLGNIISAEFALVGDIIHGRWGKIWGDLGKIVSNAFDALQTLIRAEITVVYNIALSIGKALVQGVIDGIENLATSAYDKVGSFVGDLKRKAEFWRSPPFDYGVWLGSEVVRGVASGFDTTTPVATKAAGDSVAHIKLAITGAFSGLSTTAAAVLNDQLRKAIDYAKPQIVDYWGKVLKETTKEAVAGWNIVSDAQDALNELQKQQQTQQTLQQYQDTFVDTQFAGVGYNVGMSPWEIYNLPHAASGGYVQDSGLAVIHKGETITPAGGGGSTYVFQMPNYIGDRREIEDFIRSSLNRQLRQGKGLIGVNA
jgi:phage-related protein